MPHASFYALVAAGLFVFWRLTVRVRRLVGRQPIAPAWPWLAVFLLPGVMIFLFMATLAADPRHGFALVAGAMVGSGLALWGLRLTRFEKTPEGYFYTPSAPIGLALAALFFGRLIYRAWMLYREDVTGKDLAAGFGQSPLTLAVFALAAGYYVVFSAGLLDWRYRRSHRDIYPPPAAAAASTSIAAAGIEEDLR